MPATWLHLETRHTSPPTAYRSTLSLSCSLTSVALSCRPYCYIRPSLCHVAVFATILRSSSTAKAPPKQPHSNRSLVAVLAVFVAFAAFALLPLIPNRLSPLPKTPTRIHLFRNILELATDLRLYILHRYPSSLICHSPASGSHGSFTRLSWTLFRPAYIVYMYSPRIIVAMTSFMGPLVSVTGFNHVLVISVCS